jgi:hypothetical protein
MIRFHAISARPTWLGHATSWVCVMALAVLIWLSADTAAHAWLHQDHAGADHGHACAHSCQHGHHHDAPASACDDSGCVITQFAHGQLALLLAVFLLVALFSRRSFVFAEPLQALISRAEHQLPPVCGPPRA